MNAHIPNLYDLALPELEALLAGWQQPVYRARQLYRQLYVNHNNNPNQMSDLPLALRARLAQQAYVGNLRLVRTQHDDEGMTRKALFALPDGAAVESVLMVYPDRATACVSTQAGCAMGCLFCATGKLGLLRNLSSGEIVEQVLWATREIRAMGGDLSAATDGPHHLTNVVFMGMGEPFANYDRWWGAVERLHDPQGFNLGARNMTVSTVGLPPGIRRLADEQLPINLAISLHAPDDELRTELMPINRRYPIAELLTTARDYIARTNRRVSFEYVLLQGRNDTPRHALMLAGLLYGMLCHVNLIPWNPVPGTPLGRSEQRHILAFQKILRDHHIACTVRIERGIAIAAACGQLAGDEEHSVPSLSP